LAIKKTDDSLLNKSTLWNSKFDPDTDKKHQRCRILVEKAYPIDKRRNQKVVKRLDVPCAAKQRPVKAWSVGHGALEPVLRLRSATGNLRQKVYIFDIQYNKCKQ